MPDMLARAFAVPRPATSDPFATDALGALMSRIASDVETRLRPVQTKAIQEGCIEAVKQMSKDVVTKIYAKSHEEIQRKTLDYSHDLRADADYQFFAELEEHRLDLTLAKDEGLEEIRRELIANREDIVATAAEVEVQTGANLQEQVDDAWELTKRALSMREEVLLQRIREVVERGQHRHPPSAPRAGPRRRGGSVPL
jgi:hypothetical protein